MSDKIPEEENPYSNIIQSYLANSPWLKEAQEAIANQQNLVKFPDSLLDTIRTIQGSILPDWSSVVNLNNPSLELANIVGYVVPPLSSLLPNNFLQNIKWAEFLDSLPEFFLGEELFYDEDFITNQVDEITFFTRISFLMNALEKQEIFLKSPYFSLIALAIKHLNNGDYVSSTTILKDVFIMAKDLLPESYTDLWYPGMNKHASKLWNDSSNYLDYIDENLKNSLEWNDNFSRYLAAFLVPALVSTDFKEIPENFAKVETRHRSAHGAYEIGEMDRIFNKNNSWFYIHYSLVMLLFVLRQNNFEAFEKITEDYSGLVS